MLNEIIHNLQALDPLWGAGLAGALFVLCCIAAKQALSAPPVDHVAERLDARRRNVTPLPRGDWRRRVMRVQG